MAAALMFAEMSILYCWNAGVGLQGPAGVRTDGPSGDDEPMTSHGDVDLEPGAAERPEGIVGPSGICACMCVLSVYVYAPRSVYVSALCASVCLHACVAPKLPTQILHLCNLPYTVGTGVMPVRFAIAWQTKCVLCMHVCPLCICVIPACVCVCPVCMCVLCVYAQFVCEPYYMYVLCVYVRALCACCAC